MYRTTQNFTQVPSVFGSGYIIEAHGDATHRFLPPAERPIEIVNEGIGSLTTAMFDQMLKSLRSALSL